MGVAAEIVVICSLWRTRMRIRAEGEKEIKKKRKEEGKEECARNKRRADVACVSRLHVFSVPLSTYIQGYFKN